MATIVSDSGTTVRARCALKVPGLCQAADQAEIILAYRLASGQRVTVCPACAQHQVETGAWILKQPNQPLSKRRRVLADYVRRYTKARDDDGRLQIAQDYQATHPPLWSLAVTDASGRMRGPWWVQEQDIPDLGPVRVALPQDRLRPPPFTAYVRPPLTIEAVDQTGGAHFIYLRDPVDIIDHDADYALQARPQEDGSVVYRALLLAPVDPEQYSYEWRNETYPAIMARFRRWGTAMRKPGCRAVHMLAADCVIAQDTSDYPSDQYAILVRVGGRWRKRQDFRASSLDAGIMIGLELWHQSARMG